MNRPCRRAAVFTKIAAPSSAARLGMSRLDDGRISLSSPSTALAAASRASAAQLAGVAYAVAHRANGDERLIGVDATD